MKNSLSLIFCLFIPFMGFSQLTIEGSRFVEVTPDASTGLKKLYVLQVASDAVLQYQSSSSSISWEKFSALGGGYAEPVSGLQKNGDIFSIKAEGDMGYIINDGSNQFIFWICDYSKYPYNISDIILAENDCDRLLLNIAGSAPQIPYYTVNGRRMILDRQIVLSYNTLKYNSDTAQYTQISSEVSLEYAENSVAVPAPLCSTNVTIHPGRFASAWDDGAIVVSESVSPVAVDAITAAVQTEKDSDNLIGGSDASSESLGGSAPCEIAFSAEVTDAAIYRRWEFSSDPTFENINLSFSDLDVTYVFEEAGNSYVRFVADNAEGTCQFTSETYTISIGESRLECPNAFSPGASEGVNDEWKVSYQSIINFHCEIFNRWGQRLATLTDPSQGWDGKVGGKVVPSGVYFYVINALGSDGKKYKLSGDINVISSRRDSNISTSPVE